MVGFAQKEDINFDQYIIVSLSEFLVTFLSKIGTYLLASSDIMEKNRTLLLASKMPVPISRDATCYTTVLLLLLGAFDCWVLFSRQGAETRAAGILEFRPAWLSSRRVSAGSI
jgi:hypothetical protein